MEGVVGTSYQGDIALDDFSFTNGQCALTPAIAKPQTGSTLAPTTLASTTFKTATSCKDPTVF